MNEHGPHLGRLLASAREEAGLTLKQVAKGVGISIPFLHDVEHGRRPLAVGWWPYVVGVIPGLTLKMLADARISGADRVEIRVTDLSAKQRRLVRDALVAEAELAQRETEEESDAEKVRAERRGAQ